eukprot:356603-Chlamydomonas_euryale.AAC.2
MLSPYLPPPPPPNNNNPLRLPICAPTPSVHPPICEPAPNNALCPPICASSETRDMCLPLPCAHLAASAARCRLMGQGYLCCAHRPNLVPKRSTLNHLTGTSSTQALSSKTATTHAAAWSR